MAPSEYDMDGTSFNVAQLLRQSIGAVRGYPVQAAVDIERGEEVAFQGQMNLVRTDQGVLTQVVLEATIQETCSRCLTIFNIPLHLEFQEEFYPTVEVNLGYRLPPPADASAFTINENHILDIGEAVRQYTLMALPIKPLCRPECAGICPGCGQDLNLGQCHCPSLPFDIRWVRLLEPLGTTPGKEGAN